MLNIFPIMFLSLIAHTILRVFAGVLLMYLGATHGSKEKRTALSLRFNNRFFGGATTTLIIIIEVVSGGMLILGFLTQLAALCVLLLSLFFLLLRKKYVGLIPPPVFFILLFAVALSLFITGAGAFAIDFPI
jgi:uncharacterized membrane protein YphA (DoxX/SURF4 family)